MTSEYVKPSGEMSWKTHLSRCTFALMGIRLPKSFPEYTEGCSGNGASSKRTAFSVFPPLADERSTTGSHSCLKPFKGALQLSSSKILTISHSLQVVPFSFLLSSFLRTTATCANVGILVQRQRRFRNQSCRT